MIIVVKLYNNIANHSLHMRPLGLDETNKTTLYAFGRYTNKLFFHLFLPICYITSIIGYGFHGFHDLVCSDDPFLRSQISREMTFAARLSHAYAYRYVHITRTTIAKQFVRNLKLRFVLKI